MRPFSNLIPTLIAFPTVTAVVVALVFHLFPLAAHAQSADGQSGDGQEEDRKLTATILRLDSLFWKSYNECDLTENARYLAADIEFFHDKGGITRRDTALTNSLARNICGNPDQRIRREQVPGSVNVFALRDGNRIYGAIVSGEHWFHVSRKGKPERREGLANFTNLWLLEGTEWKMARVLSYNHHAAPFVQTRKPIAVRPRTLKRYGGSYQNPASGVFTVRSQGSHLTLEGTSSSMDIFAQTPNLFFSQERDLQFEFITGKTPAGREGKVTEIIVYENGQKVDQLMRVN